MQEARINIGPLSVFFALFVFISMTSNAVGQDNIPKCEETYTELRCDNGIAIDLWYKGSVPDSCVIHNDIRVYGHPCGYYKEICTNSIPMNDPEVEPNWVYEISTHKKVINKWPVPIDSLVYGISGDTIYITSPSLNLETKYDYAVVGVKPDGSIFKIPPQKDSSFPTTKECPNITGYPDIKFMGCHKFKDQKTNRIRILAVNSPCT